MLSKGGRGKVKKVEAVQKCKGGGRLKVSGRVDKWAGGHGELIKRASGVRCQVSGEFRVSGVR